MSGYTPKPGDKIRVQPKPIEGRVVKRTGDGQYLVDHDGPGGYPLRDHFHPAKYDFELIKAAPVPFEVGKPITPEMGEPPDRSVVRDALGNTWVRSGDFWLGVGDGATAAWARLAVGKLRLLWLGGTPVTS